MMPLQKKTCAAVIQSDTSCACESKEPTLLAITTNLNPPPYLIAVESKPDTDVNVKRGTQFLPGALVAVPRQAARAALYHAAGIGRVTEPRLPGRHGSRPCRVTIAPLEPGRSVRPKPRAWDIDAGASPFQARLVLPRPLDQNFRWNGERFVQLPDHQDGEAELARQHYGKLDAGLKRQRDGRDLSFASCQL